VDDEAYDLGPGSRAHGTIVPDPEVVLAHRVEVRDDDFAAGQVILGQSDPRILRGGDPLAQLDLVGSSLGEVMAFQHCRPARSVLRCYHDLDLAGGNACGRGNLGRYHLERKGVQKELGISQLVGPHGYVLASELVVEGGAASEEVPLDLLRLVPGPVLVIEHPQVLGIAEVLCRSLEPGRPVFVEAEKGMLLQGRPRGEKGGDHLRDGQVTRFRVEQQVFLNLVGHGPPRLMGFFKSADNRYQSIWVSQR